MSGLTKVPDTENLNRIGLESETIQILLSLALLDKEETNDFVNQRQVALYIILYWCSARFEEAATLSVGEIFNGRLSLHFNIKKGKKNQWNKLQLCWIHHNFSGSLGNFDPVFYLWKVSKLQEMLCNHKCLWSSFPNLHFSWDVVRHQKVISLKVPEKTLTYDNYPKCLKVHLEHQYTTSLRVTAGDFGFHSFRIGRLNVLGIDRRV